MEDRPSLRGICLDRVHGGYRVKRTRNSNVFVLASIYDWRLVVTSRTNPAAEIRVWAYFGTEMESFTRAVLAAWNWNPDNGTDPGEWNLNIQTGERHERNGWRTPSGNPDPSGETAGPAVHGSSPDH